MSIDDEFEKRIAAKKERDEAESKSNGDATEPKIIKLPCGCETYIGEKNSFSNMTIPFPFVKVEGQNPVLTLQFCKKCKEPVKSWWTVAKPNSSKLFKPPNIPRL